MYILSTCCQWRYIPKGFPPRAGNPSRGRRRRRCWLRPGSASRRANRIAEDWYRRTALCDLLQLGDEEVNKDRLYRGLDRLLAHKAALEAYLPQRCGELFAIQNEVLLYDVRSTYFEGEAEANPQARRGYSRDHRPGCKQGCTALVVTFDGLQLGYEVFAGNTHDSRTLQTIMATMEARHALLGRVWITDRGMASAANLAWLRDTGRRYIIPDDIRQETAALGANTIEGQQGGGRNMQPLRLAADAKPRLVHVLHRRACHEITHRLNKTTKTFGASPAHSRVMAVAILTPKRSAISVASRFSGSN
jgi:hypothetical protein